MKAIKVETPVDAEAFAATFRRTVPHASGDLDTGRIYGAIDRDRFSLYCKSHWIGQGADFFRSGMGVYLSGRIRGGHVSYTYRRTALHVLVTSVVPLIMLLVCVFLSLFVFKMPQYLAFSVLPLCFLPFYFYKPKGKSADLLDCMMRLVEQSRRQKLPHSLDNE